MEDQILDLQNKIATNEALSKERWDAYLNANPIKHVQNIRFENSKEQTNGVFGVAIVEIAGLAGTICGDYPTPDDETLNFLCRQMGYQKYGNLSFAPTPHLNDFPILLNSKNIQCPENATSFADCTSGPMGFEHCESNTDLVFGCVME